MYGHVEANEETALISEPLITAESTPSMLTIQEALLRSRNLLPSLLGPAGPSWTLDCGGHLLSLSSFN